MISRCGNCGGELDTGLNCYNALCPSNDNRIYTNESMSNIPLRTKEQVINEIMTLLHELRNL